MAAQKLVSVEHLTGFITLDDDQRLAFDGFIGGESLSALHALSASADPLPVVGRTGIDHFALGIKTIRTLHMFYLLP